MSFDTLLNELETKNNEICQFLRRTLNTSNVKIDNSIFDLLAKKMQNHDKLLVNALDETNKRIEKITLAIAKHVK